MLFKVILLKRENIKKRKDLQCALDLITDGVNNIINFH